MHNRVRESMATFSSGQLQADMAGLICSRHHAPRCPPRRESWKRLCVRNGYDPIKITKQKGTVCSTLHNVQGKVQGKYCWDREPSGILSALAKERHSYGYLPKVILTWSPTYVTQCFETVVA